MTRKFQKWWASVNKQPREQRIEIIGRWLRYACKTVALRGDQNQQKIVYTVNSRYKNSNFKRITKKNAWLIWSVVNQKQSIYKSIVKQQQQPQRERVAPTIIVKKKTIDRKIIRS